MFNLYPYLNLADLNLDYVFKRLKELGEANGIKFDDTDTQIGATNVQEAIEKLNELIVDISTQVSQVTIIDNGISETSWTNGASYNHLQTVNTPTLMNIIGALRDDKFIIMRREPALNTEGYHLIMNIEYDGGLFRHRVTFVNVLTHKISTLDIYGLYDDANVYAEISPDVVVNYVNTFNSRTGNVIPAAGDYTATQVDYDNTFSGLAAIDVQNAIDEVAASVPSPIVNSFNSRTGAVTPAASDYDADQVDYDNSVSGLTATDTQAAIDEVVNVIPTAASQLSYDNTVSGLAATDVQDALDEIANDVLSSGVASFNTRTGAVSSQAGDYTATQVDYDNTFSGLAAIDVQNAIDEVVNNINGAAVFDHTQVFSAAPDGIKTNGQLISEARTALMTYLTNNPQYYYSYDNVLLDLNRDLAERHEILSSYQDIRFFGMRFSGADVINTEIFITPAPAYLVATNGVIADETSTVATSSFYIVIEVYRVL